MRILAKENVAGDAVAALRWLDHGEAWFAANAAGASDREVFQRAANEDRSVVTFDKDFGELAFHDGLSAQLSSRHRRQSSRLNPNNEG